MPTDQNALIRNIDEISQYIQQMEIGDRIIFNDEHDNHIPIIKLPDNYYRIDYENNVNAERISSGNIIDRIARELTPSVPIDNVGGRKSKKSRKNKTIKIKSHDIKQKIIIKFLEILNMIKLYHWGTLSYATHKATDDLYAKLNENIDSFVEVMIGKDGKRIDLSHNKSISLKASNSINDFKREIENFKLFLVNLDDSILKSKSNTDLFNIRDELLANLNQFTYLLTLNK